MNWFLMALKKYAVFDGRARRKEFWMFILFYFILSIVVNVIVAITKIQILGMIFGLGMLCPYIGVSIRRMHDTDRSGWWILLPIVNLIFYIQEGQQGENRYGPDPKEMGEPA
jgi:uncharacterized membrane protein YhaH (DUF805 family)